MAEIPIGDRDPDETEIVQLSNRAMAAIRAAAKFTLREEGVRQPDGTWLVPFGKATVDRIRQRQLEGESLSDCVERTLATLPKDGSTRRRLQ